MLGHVGIGAGEQHAEIGPVAARRPHLLPVDDPLVAVLLGLAVQAGEVGARARLGEELAPGTLTGDDVAEVLALLFVGAVHGDGRTREQRAEASRRGERTEVGDGLLHAQPLGAREPLAEPLLRPGGHGPSRRAEPFPPVGDGEVGIPVGLEPGDLLEGRRPIVRALGDHERAIDQGEPGQSAVAEPDEGLEVLALAGQAKPPLDAAGVRQATARPRVAQQINHGWHVVLGIDGSHAREAHVYSSPGAMLTKARYSATS